MTYYVDALPNYGLTALTSVMDNSELSGRAEDAMSDIEMFVKK